MIQKTLFDRPANICRKSDPITSHQSAAETEPKLGKIQDRMLKSIAAFKSPPTANEAAEECVFTFGEASQETYRKRALELVRAGRIVTCGERKCEVTGKTATVYKVKEKPQ
jgi:hypothetical protein